MQADSRNWERKAKKQISAQGLQGVQPAAILVLDC